MPSALFVVSEEGDRGEEYVEPLTALDDAGFEITVATPTGAPPVVDGRSLDPDSVGEETAERVRGVGERDERLNDPERLGRVSADGRGAVVFPGATAPSGISIRTATPADCSERPSRARRGRPRSSVTRSACSPSPAGRTDRSSSRAAT